MYILEKLLMNTGRVLFDMQTVLLNLLIFK